MDYFKKYIKYKNKYLNLQKQIGGDHHVLFDQDNDINKQQIETSDLFSLLIANELGYDNYDEQIKNNVGNKKVVIVDYQNIINIIAELRQYHLFNDFLYRSMNDNNVILIIICKKGRYRIYDHLNQNIFNKMSNRLFIYEIGYTNTNNDEIVMSGSNDDFIFWLLTILLFNYVDDINNLKLITQDKQKLIDLNKQNKTLYNDLLAGDILISINRIISINTTLNLSGLIDIILNKLTTQQKITNGINPFFFKFVKYVKYLQIVDQFNSSNDMTDIDVNDVNNEQGLNIEQIKEQLYQINEIINEINRNKSLYQFDLNKNIKDIENQINILNDDIIKLRQITSDDLRFSTVNKKININLGKITELEQKKQSLLTDLDFNIKQFDQAIIEWNKYKDNLFIETSGLLAKVYKFYYDNIKINGENIVRYIYPITISPTTQKIEKLKINKHNKNKIYNEIPPFIKFLFYIKFIKYRTNKPGQDMMSDDDIINFLKN